MNFVFYIFLLFNLVESKINKKFYITSGASSVALGGISLAIQIYLIKIDNELNSLNKSITQKLNSLEDEAARKLQEKKDKILDNTRKLFYYFGKFNIKNPKTIFFIY